MQNYYLKCGYLENPPSKRNRVRRSFKKASMLNSVLLQLQHLVARCEAGQTVLIIKYCAVLMLNSQPTLCLFLNQEACALLLEESLHYIQAKFLCNATDQAAKAFHSNFVPFEIHPSSSSSSSSHTSPFLVHRLGLVIDGRTLAYALDKSLEDKFLAVARSCRSVLCCRSTPLQKSMVVKLVRNKLKVMTLAIGNRHNILVYLVSRPTCVRCQLSIQRQMFSSSHPILHVF